MHYRQIYDIISEGYPGWSQLDFSVVIASVAIFIFIFRQRIKMGVAAKLATIVSITLCFFAIIALVIFAANYLAFRGVIKAIKHGECKTIDGDVSELRQPTFHSTGLSKMRSKPGSFKVAGVTFFCWSSKTRNGQIGFQKIESLHDGLPVRIDFVKQGHDNIITHLDVSE